MERPFKNTANTAKIAVRIDAQEDAELVAPLSIQCEFMWEEVVGQMLKGQLCGLSLLHGIRANECTTQERRMRVEYCCKREFYGRELEVRAFTPGSTKQIVQK
jgi:hypothetical protein